MSDLYRARACLQYEQANLAAARINAVRFGWGPDLMARFENAVLAALSWVWEEQEAARIVWQPIATRGKKALFARLPRGREPRSLPQMAARP